MKKILLLSILSLSILNGFGFSKWKIGDKPQHVIQKANMHDITLSADKNFGCPDQNGFKRSIHLDTKRKIELICYSDKLMGSKSQVYLYFDKNTNKIKTITVYIAEQISLVDAAIKGRKSIASIRTGKTRNITNSYERKLIKTLNSKYGKIKKVSKSPIPGHNRIFIWNPSENSKVTLEETFGGFKIEYIDIKNQRKKYKKDLEQL